MSRHPVAFLMITALIASLVISVVPANVALAQTVSAVYVVQMLDNPVVAYDGGIAGLKATRPGKGKKIDPNDNDVVKYAGYLDGRHNDALARVGGGRKLYDYRYSFNGFAAQLTAAQVKALRNAPGVLEVQKSELVSIDTSSTPTFLGLDAPGGLWDQLGGVGSAGEDVVIGIIDSGIWPESLSFSDRTGTNGNASKEGKLSYQQIPGWHGKCAAGEDFNASMCNQKLIGAQRFNAGWGGDAALETERPWEFMSPRDYNGHGTHTASTAGGNHGVAATGPAAVFGTISGIAPRARIAAYKALWSTEDGSTASGFTIDLVAAIDQAVADGVDVINYSISGTRTNFLDAVQVAYLFAADAGVFVSASAGNSGPTTGTAAHPGPWLTTVAAGTHNRDGQGSVTLGNGTTYNGASVASKVGPAPFIDSTAAGLEGADPVKVALCYADIDNEGDPVLDPAKIAGKIVLCDRGVTARVNKSLAVQEAGGAGMVLANTSPNSLNADFHFVPSVHVQNTDRAALKAYAATAGATATINDSTIVFNAPAPLTASFSSRGPLAAGGADLLKPDVIAPGQDILAAVAPTPASAGRSFNLLSGTSMSAPHVAGLAALLKDLHPTWSPMAIKSALMTSASDVLDGPNTNQLVIFRQGAGHVRPNSAADPGLVYDAGFNDWLAFLCGTTTGVSAATCNALKAAGYSFDPSDLNVASISIGDLPGIQSVSRRVTNVGNSRATYTSSFAGIGGLTATVTPSSLTLNPGETKSFKVDFTRTTATLTAFVGGQLTWSDGTHTVRSPVIMRPVGISAPAAFSFATASGSTTFAIKTGYAGTLVYTRRGLTPSTITADKVTDDPTDNFDTAAPAGNKGITTHNFTVTAGTSAFRINMFDADTDGNDDIDLFLYRVTTSGTPPTETLTLVGTSTGATSAEQIQLLFPAAGNYRLFVHGFATDGPDANYSFHSWQLTSDAGNMTVTGPTTVTIGMEGTVTLAWSGLEAGKRYLGHILYQEGTTTHGSTIIRIDP